MLTLFAGATFLWGTVSSGSLWPGVVGHAAYDFFLLDMRSFATEASAPFTLLPLGGVFLLGGYCLFRLFRLPADGEAMAFLADRQTSSAGASPR
jgi:hypothetical protein